MIEKLIRKLFFIKIYVIFFDRNGSNCTNHIFVGVKSTANLLLFHLGLKMLDYYFAVNVNSMYKPQHYPYIKILVVVL